MRSFEGLSHHTSEANIQKALHMRKINTLTSAEGRRLQVRKGRQSYDGTVLIMLGRKPKSQRYTL